MSHHRSIISLFICTTLISACGAEAGLEPQPTPEVNTANAPQTAETNSDQATYATQLAETPSETRWTREVSLPNGNTLTFVADLDGAVSMLEHGLPGTNALDSVPELAHATAYETFLATAPLGQEPPTELLTQHAEEDARRAELGLPGMPTGFRLDTASDYVNVTGPRAFNGCEDVSEWEDINCTEPGVCHTNWLPPWTRTFHGTNPSFHIHHRQSICGLAVGGGNPVHWRTYLKKFGQSFYELRFDLTVDSPGEYYVWKYTWNAGAQSGREVWAPSGFPMVHLSHWAAN